MKVSAIVPIPGKTSNGAKKKTPSTMSNAMKRRRPWNSISQNSDLTENHNLSVISMLIDPIMSIVSPITIIKPINDPNTIRTAEKRVNPMTKNVKSKENATP